MTRSRRPPSRLDLRAGAVDGGASLERFVALRGGISADEARAAILRGGCFLRGKRVRDPSAKVCAGERVELTLREGGQLPDAPSALDPSRLLHIDPLVIGVDKPAFVLAQEGRAGGPALPDLCAVLLAARGEKGEALLVHRLDRGTTGATVLARTRAAQAALLEEFRAGRAEKEYRALVLGEPREESGEIDLALGPDPSAPGRTRPDPRGAPARTRFRVLERLRGATLVSAHPETGRTHQIRAHFKALGHPLLGDVRYGGPRAVPCPFGARVELARPLLHALSLRVLHPGGRGLLLLRAPLPADLVQACALLREGGRKQRSR